MALKRSREEEEKKKNALAAQENAEKEEQVFCIITGILNFGVFVILLSCELLFIFRASLYTRALNRVTDEETSEEEAKEVEEA